MNRITFLACFVFVIGLFPEVFGNAQSDPKAVRLQSTREADLYETGTPSYTEIWVDPVSGNDSNPGTLASPFRTLAHAWETVPTSDPLTQAVRINLQPGTYTSDMIPLYWENRHGTFSAPIMIRGNGTVRDQVILQETVNVYNVQYVYFENLSIIFNGDVFHCELCDHILLRNMVLNGGAQQAQETIKVNQSQYFYVENSDVFGAWNVTIDFVAVEYGHVINNQIHNAGDWCMYFKGGSAYLTVEANTIFDCGNGGFSAGQGTGFQYMLPPWIQYETYDIKVVNNVIHDVEGAGMGVNGGYNILMAYNTMYRVGSRDHIFEAAFGTRSCNGIPGDMGRERCQQYLDQGGWGTAAVDTGENYIRIPNKNVYIYNNVFYNPSGYSSQWMHFAIYEPYANPPESNVPNPAVTDDNLQIRGNVIWNGDSSMPLGIEDTLACQDSNPTCNASQLIAENSINMIEPHFVNPAAGDFHPLGEWMNSVTTYSIPAFTWDLVGVPSGNNNNEVAADFEGNVRLTTNPPGAYCLNAPIVVSILRADLSPTNAASVNFTVTFSKPVTGVDADDFSVIMSGVSGAAVSGVSGTGSIYTVAVNTGSGDGTIRLDVVDDNSIVDATSNPLGGAALGDGNFTTGEVYTINKSSIFIDVPLDYSVNSYIERLYNAGITGGCSLIPLMYCPENTVTRAQMAVFLLRGIHGSDYIPPAVGAGTGFTDVPTNHPVAAWIKQLAAEGITGGCSNGNYCPDATVTRAQMAVFLLRSKYTSAYTPPPANGDFTDVPVHHLMAAWIEQLAAEGITGGCGAGVYCPDGDVTRAQMAVFLVRTFNLP